MRVRKIALFLFVLTIMIASSGFVFGANTNPSSDLADALIYWQEQAIKAANENALLSAEKERLSLENQDLKANLDDAESAMRKLQALINEMAIQAEKIDSLRIQAENALSLANLEIQRLEQTIKKLSSARFGLLFGATYNGEKIAGLAGVTINF